MLTFSHHLIRWLRFHTDAFFAGATVGVSKCSFVSNQLFGTLQGIVFLREQSIYLIQNHLIPTQFFLALAFVFQKGDFLIEFFV